MRSFTARVPAGPARRVPVVVGAGALARLASELAAGGTGGVVAVVSDSNVAPLHGAPFVAALAGAGLPARLVTFPAGEPSKTRETKARLEDALLSLGAGRDARVVALGGGVTGDLAGFVAATLHRGVRVWQAPTTTLAMADAALGGKTAVDVPLGKNLVGAFHQPEGVFADLDTLATLPEAVYRAGFAEIVKSAAIADARLFERLERSVRRLLARDTRVLGPVVLACLKVKARIVASDEREAGVRMVLNFGHTVAHAIEAASGYAVPHGPAVAIGLAVEARLATEATGLPPDDAARIARLLEAFGLPVRPPAELDLGAVVEAARRDKKSRGGRTRYALPVALGRMRPGADVAVGIDDARLVGALRAD